jgi:ribosome-associated toxin RatA of RatAB toxin-antitoxin module
MPKFNMTRKYPYAAAEIFAVASDVASYSAFVPLVRDSKVWKRQTQDDGTRTFKAALTISYKKLNIREVIRADMTVDDKAMTIAGTSADGMLKHLNSLWKVRALAEGGAEVEMDIDYAMKNKMMQVLVSGMFDLAMRRIANALGDRVAAIYGHQRVEA